MKKTIVITKNQYGDLYGFIRQAPWMVHVSKSKELILLSLKNYVLSQYGTDEIEVIDESEGKK